ncbi:MAG: hypothetical protein QNJ47_12200 [Nostocaceae cyanobacterium]|nr:hypothetical protein [Nostocaceae cyanobacterium]
MRYNFSLTHHPVKTLVRCAVRQHNGNKAEEVSTPGHLLQVWKPKQRSVLAFCLPYIFFQKPNMIPIELPALID